MTTAKHKQDAQAKRDADKNAPRDGGTHRKSSGEKAADEAAARRQAAAERSEKAEKAKREGGVTPTAPPVENRQDVLVVAGEDVRDGADIDDQAGPFVFDQDAKTVTVDHFAVASDASRLVLEIDGKYTEFNVQQSLALRRLVGAGTVNLNS